MNPVRIHLPEPPPKPVRPKPDPQRLGALLTACGAPFVILFALIVVTERSDRETIVLDLGIAHQESVEPLEQEIPEAERELPPEPVQTPAVDLSVDTPELSASDALAALTVPTPLSVVRVLPPADAATVALVKSPVALKTLAGAARSAVGRASALRRFGGSAAGEAAVLRALRWLKACQRPDGSWRAKGEGDPTAFALLAFLSHGEGVTSAEFGPTVRAAIEHLAEHHGNNMAVYALTEAAAVVRTPVLSDLATEAVREFCLRQPAKLKANVGGIIQRYAAVMVIAAARLARLKVAELESVRQTYAEAFRDMRDAKAANGFAKVKGLGAWHYMVAGVCLQYLGFGEEPTTRAMLTRLDSIWQPATLGPTPVACCPVRSNYFATMIFFNAGGPLWEKWNQGLRAAYADSQTIEGDRGYWRCRDQHIGDQPFWTTCYIAHQLMIYYRYLPTYSQEAWNRRPQANGAREGPRRGEEPVVVEVDL